MMGRYSEEQVAKLRHDAYGFTLVADMINNYLKELDAEPLSTARVSMTTTLHTNMGFAFELLLKSIFAVREKSVPRTHTLAIIFDALPFRNQNELEKIYRDSDVYKMSAYMIAPSMPQAPMTKQGAGLRGFLSLLDEVGLYGRRYSFETYTTHDWWIEVDADPVIKLMGTIRTYVDNLLPTTKKGTG